MARPTENNRHADLVPPARIGNADFNPFYDDMDPANNQAVAREDRPFIGGNHALVPVPLPPGIRDAQNSGSPAFGTGSALPSAGDAAFPASSMAPIDPSGYTVEDLPMRNRPVAGRPLGPYPPAISSPHRGGGLA